MAYQEEIRIEIPEGFILDEEKYRSNIIAFLPKPVDPLAHLPKPVDPLAHLPKSWEELKEIKGWYIDDNSNVKEAREGEEMNSEKGNENIVPTESQAKAILALCQLLQLRDRYNNGEQLVMNGRDVYYCIWNMAGEITANSYITTNCILKFKTRELRDHFLTHHRALIEEAKELL